MSRSLTSAMQTAVAEATLRRVWFVRLALDSGAARYNSRHRDYAFDTSPFGAGVETFQGVGAFGSLSAIAEGAELQSYSVEMELSGIDPANISAALGEDVQGRKCVIWLGLVDAEYELVASPKPVWIGRMDQMPIALGKTARVGVTAKSVVASWEVARDRRVSNADQQAHYPGDKFNEFDTQLEEKSLRWGWT